MNSVARAQRSEAVFAAPSGGKEVLHRSGKDIFHSQLRLRREINITRGAITITAVATLLFLYQFGAMAFADALNGECPALCRAVLYLAIVTCLLIGNYVHQLSRLGYLKRLAEHRPRDWKDLWRGAILAPKSVMTLIPAYKEELNVNEQSILSAALQHYTKRRVVLLIDNPPDTTDLRERAALAATRALVKRIAAELAAANRQVHGRLDEFGQWLQSPRYRATAVGDSLANLYEFVADWFSEQSEKYPSEVPADELFVECVFRSRARLLLEEATTLRSLSIPSDDPEGLSDLIGFHLTVLGAVFDVEVSSFERRRYVNLSHEPNKAMNLNSYLSVMGRKVREVRKDGELFLEMNSSHADAVLIPTSDFVATLDADSILVPDYLLRLVGLMGQEGNERVAVVQTPYSAVPQPETELERVAGATTDVQYLLHQGFTAYGATFWVGANAVLRVPALKDIVETEEERGYPIQRFIQDRTVIEDTESTLDLARKGWRLYNYPERLSYSATPRDFGSLMIQRRRWANGGLIILPKLLRGLGGDAVCHFRSLMSRIIGFHYLTSLATVNVGLLFLIFLGGFDEFPTLWLSVAALPYYVLFARDLMQAGYGLPDLLRVYALNVMLLPVNLAGVAKSVEQLFTGAKIPFHRTPKVSGKTAVPTFYAATWAVLLVTLCWMSIADFRDGHLTSAVFALINASFLGFALTHFVGADEIIALASSESEDEAISGEEEIAEPSELLECAR